MSGKGYSMQEKKALLDYIIEKNAYSETKGRAFWVDYANSGKTIRTWQSLKEVYLKRVLPDIKNPYYKISPDIIQNFRSGIYRSDEMRSDKMNLKWTSRNNNVDGVQNIVHKSSDSLVSKEQPNDNATGTSFENEQADSCIPDVKQPKERGSKIDNSMVNDQDDGTSRDRNEGDHVLSQIVSDWMSDRTTPDLMIASSPGLTPPNQSMPQILEQTKRPKCIEDSSNELNDMLDFVERSFVSGGKLSHVDSSEKLDTLNSTQDLIQLLAEDIEHHSSDDTILQPALQNIITDSMQGEHSVESSLLPSNQEMIYSNERVLQSTKPCLAKTALQSQTLEKATPDSVKLKRINKINQMLRSIINFDSSEPMQRHEQSSMMQLNHSEDSSDSVISGIQEVKFIAELAQEKRNKKTKSSMQKTKFKSINNSRKHKLDKLKTKINKIVKQGIMLSESEKLKFCNDGPMPITNRSNILDNKNLEDADDSSTQGTPACTADSNKLLENKMESSKSNPKLKTNEKSIKHAPITLLSSSVQVNHNSRDKIIIGKQSNIRRIREREKMTEIARPESRKSIHVQTSPDITENKSKVVNIVDQSVQTCKELFEVIHEPSAVQDGSKRNAISNINVSKATNTTTVVHETDNAVPAVELAADFGTISTSLQNGHGEGSTNAFKTGLERAKDRKRRKDLDNLFGFSSGCIKNIRNRNTSSRKRENVELSSPDFANRRRKFATDLRDTDESEEELSHRTPKRRYTGNYSSSSIESPSFGEGNLLAMVGGCFYPVYSGIPGGSMQIVKWIPTQKRKVAKLKRRRKMSVHSPRCSTDSEADNSLKRKHRHKIKSSTQCRNNAISSRSSKPEDIKFPNATMAKAYCRAILRYHLARSKGSPPRMRDFQRVESQRDISWMNHRHRKTKAKRVTSATQECNANTSDSIDDLWNIIDNMESGIKSSLHRQNSLVPSRSPMPKLAQFPNTIMAKAYCAAILRYQLTGSKGSPPRMRDYQPDSTRKKILRNQQNREFKETLQVVYLTSESDNEVNERQGSVSTHQILQPEQDKSESHKNAQLATLTALRPDSGTTDLINDFKNTIAENVIKIRRIARTAENTAEVNHLHMKNNKRFVDPAVSTNDMASTSFNETILKQLSAVQARSWDINTDAKADVQSSVAKVSTGNGAHQDTKSEEQKKPKYSVTIQKYGEDVANIGIENTQQMQPLLGIMNNFKRRYSVTDDNMADDNEVKAIMAKSLKVDAKPNMVEIGDLRETTSTSVTAVLAKEKDIFDEIHRCGDDLVLSSERQEAMHSMSKRKFLPKKGIDGADRASPSSTSAVENNSAYINSRDVLQQSLQTAKETSTERSLTPGDANANIDTIVKKMSPEMGKGPRNAASDVRSTKRTAKPRVATGKTRAKKAMSENAVTDKGQDNTSTVYTEKTRIEDIIIDFQSADSAKPNSTSVVGNNSDDINSENLLQSDMKMVEETSTEISLTPSNADTDTSTKMISPVIRKNPRNATLRVQRTKNIAKPRVIRSKKGVKTMSESAVVDNSQDNASIIRAEKSIATAEFNIDSDYEAAAQRSRNESSVSEIKSDNSIAGTCSDFWRDMHNPTEHVNMELDSQEIVSRGNKSVNSIMSESAVVNGGQNFTLRTKNPIEDVIIVSELNDMITESLSSVANTNELNVGKSPDSWREPTSPINMKLSDAIISPILHENTEHNNLSNVATIEPTDSRTDTTTGLLVNNTKKKPLKRSNKSTVIAQELSEHRSVRRKSSQHSQSISKTDHGLGGSQKQLGSVGVHMTRSALRAAENAAKITTRSHNIQDLKLGEVSVPVNTNNEFENSNRLLECPIMHEFRPLVAKLSGRSFQDCFENALNKDYNPDDIEVQSVVYEPIPEIRISKESIKGDLSPVSDHGSDYVYSSSPTWSDSGSYFDDRRISCMDSCYISTSRGGSHSNLSNKDLDVFRQFMVEQHTDSEVTNFQSSEIPNTLSPSSLNIISAEICSNIDELNDKTDSSKNHKRTSTRKNRSKTDDFTSVSGNSAQVAMTPINLDTVPSKSALKTVSSRIESVPKENVMLKKLKKKRVSFQDASKPEKNKASKRASNPVNYHLSDAELKDIFPPDCEEEKGAAVEQANVTVQGSQIISTQSDRTAIDERAKVSEKPKKETKKKSISSYKSQKTKNESFDKEKIEDKSKNSGRRSGVVDVLQVECSEVEKISEAQLDMNETEHNNTVSIEMVQEANIKHAKKQKQSIIHSKKSKKFHEDLTNTTLKEKDDFIDNAPDMVLQDKLKDIILPKETSSIYNDAISSIHLDDTMLVIKSEVNVNNDPPFQEKELEGKEKCSRRQSSKKKNTITVDVNGDGKEVEKSYSILLSSEVNVHSDVYKNDIFLNNLNILDIKCANTVLRTAYYDNLSPADDGLVIESKGFSQEYVDQVLDTLNIEDLKENENVNEDSKKIEKFSSEIELSPSTDFDDRYLLPSANIVDMENTYIIQPSCSPSALLGSGKFDNSFEALSPVSHEDTGIFKLQNDTGVDKRTPRLSTSTIIDEQVKSLPCNNSSSNEEFILSAGDDAADEFLTATSASPFSKSLQMSTPSEYLSPQKMPSECDCIELAPVTEKSKPSSRSLKQTIFQKVSKWYLFSTDDSDDSAQVKDVDADNALIKVEVSPTNNNMEGSERCLDCHQ